VDDELDRRDDRELAMIQRQMEQTRASLGNKLEALESQVLDTVTTATEGVASAVEGVKATVETVSETVQSVTESLNFTKYVEDNPFGAVGCSAGVGFAAGYLLGGPRAPTEPAEAPPAPRHMPAQAAPAPPSPAPAHAESEGLLQKATLGLTALGMGALGGVLRGLIASHLPTDMHGLFNGLVKQLTDGPGHASDPQAPPSPPAEARREEEEAPPAQDGPRPQRQPRETGRPVAFSRR
jgi:ElaB/YqjD/DUF883 family membrane-anchored ribosome-binding protein